MKLDNTKKELDNLINKIDKQQEDIED